MHLWPGTTGIDEMTESYEIVEGGEKFTFKFYLRSKDVILAYKEFSGHTTQPGDYYYSDGSWSSTLQPEKTCIAIVYKELEYEWYEDDSMIKALDKIHDGGYNLTQFKDGMVHGYALAIADVSSATYTWGPVLLCEVGESSARDPEKKIYFNGYSNTQKIYSLKNDATFPAFEACWGYEVEAPHSSGWYLPSHDQFKEIIDNKELIQNRLNSLKDAGGADFINDKVSSYWSSSEASGGSAAIRSAFFMKDWHTNKTAMASAGFKTQSFRVRVVLTF